MPTDVTEITVVPSEDEGYICAIEMKNASIDGTLRLTKAEVEALITVLKSFLN